MAKRRKKKSKREEPAKITSILLKSAVNIARKTGVRALFIYGDVPLDMEVLGSEKLPFKLVLVSSHPETIARGGRRFDHSITLPEIPLTREGQVKISVVMAVSGKTIKPSDRILFLAGKPELGVLDSLTVIDVENEFSLLSSPNMLEFASEVDHSIFDQVVRLAVEIANEGREGHPVGTIIILGDTREVRKHVEQMLINPFKGHKEKERQILNPEVREVIKEMSQMDGAFIIRSNGVVDTAGAYIAAKMVPEALPQGLGSRHYSAAAITAATNAVSIAVSQSTGDVYIFKNGQIVTCIEKH